MYFSPSAKVVNVSSGTPKFFANTSFGVWANQSVIEKVLFSENAPSSNTKINSAPSSRPLIEWGIPDGKFQTPPSSTRSEEHTSELQSRGHLVCRLLLDKKNHFTS